MTVRFFMGGINHETNTFSPLPATRQRFLDMNYHRGQELIDAMRGTRTVIGGFIDAAEQQEIELVPTIHCFAMPSGAVERAVFEELMADTLDDLEAALAAGPIDGLLLGLHGAMVIEGIDDGEGEYLRRVRELVGPDMPIVTELDLHANISPESVALADVIIGYDTYPHIDVYERAVELTYLLARLVRKEVRPTVAFRRIPVLANLTAQFSGTPQMEGWLALCHQIEHRRGVLTATIACGFPYADIPDTGMFAYVCTDDDPDLAEQYVQELAQFAWDHRADFQATPMDVEEAVAYGMTQPGPILLADVADNTGAGSSGDGTELLRELIAQGARSAVVALMYDPQTVRRASEVGVGASFDAMLGGKVDELHGAPVAANVYVRAITDGWFINSGPMGAGAESSLGMAVVLEIGGRGAIEVIVTEHRRAPNDANALRSVGIEPQERQILVIKSAVHYRAAFTPLVREIVEVDAPGLASPNWNNFNFQRLRRPIYPLDSAMEWSP